MRKLTFIISLWSLALFVSCLEDVPEEACDVSTLAVAASVTIDGESYCYQTGSLIYDSNDDFIQLELYAVKNEKTTDHRIIAYFQVPAEGYQFNQTYTASSGSYFDAVSLSSGTMIIEGDNHPDDPTLMKYYGSFDLTYQTQGSPTVTSIVGSYSIELP
jgi:hypothetical protein